MTTTIFFILTSAVCPTCAQLQPAAPIHSPNSPVVSEPSGQDSEHDRRRGLLQRRQARQEHPELERTIRKFLRRLRDRRADRRHGDHPGLFKRLFHSRRRAPQDYDDGPLPPGVTVPHEEPVDLPLYPQPNQ